MIFNTEPYDGALRPIRCFRYYGYGYIRRYYARPARYRLCVNAAYAEGESACLAKRDYTKIRYPYYKGYYAA